MTYTGALLKTISFAGRSFQLLYNTNNKLQSITDGLRTTFLEQDGNGDLIRSIVTQGMIDRDTMEYTYDNHKMSRIRDPRGTVFLKNYYQNDKVYWQQDAYDKSTYFNYDTPSVGTTKVTNPTG